MVGEGLPDGTDAPWPNILQLECANLFNALLSVSQGDDMAVDVDDKLVR